MRENHLNQQTIARNENPQSSEFNLGIAKAIGLLFFFCVFSGVVPLILVFLPVSANFAQVQIVGQVVAWPVTIIIALRWGGGTFRKICPLGPFPVRIVPALILASFGMAQLVVEVAGWIPIPENFHSWLTTKVGTGKEIFLILGILIAPMTEELFFRGPILHGFLGKYSKIKAIWVSALIFSLFHILPWQMVGTLPLGLASAWLVIRTRTLWPSIICHATANLSGAMLLPFLARTFVSDVDQLKLAEHYPLPMLALGFGAFAIGVFFLWREFEGKVMVDGPN